MSLKNYIQDNRSKIDDKKMSSSADSIFEKRLKVALHQPKKGKLMYVKYIAIAAGIALLFTLGLRIISDSEYKIDKDILLASLTNDSAGARLEGIYHFDDDYVKEDNQIISVLIDILHNDNNTNVKLAAIDALLKFPGNEKIRKNLLTALGNETIPLVQIKLIKSLSNLRENRAQKPLEDLINNQETLPIVTSNATLAMAILKTQ